jgi:acyl-CoA thioester hydrolase
MVDFEKLFVVDDVLPVGQDEEMRDRVGEFLFNPGLISLAEFDLGGVLYHANYFRIYERAREALLAELGFPYPALVAAGSHLAVVESSQHFHKPVYYGMEVEVGLRCEELRTASVTLAYTFYANSSAVHDATTRHAFVTRDPSGVLRPARLPAELVQAMNSRFTS